MPDFDVSAGRFAGGATLSLYYERDRGTVLQTITLDSSGAGTFTDLYTGTGYVASDGTRDSRFMIPEDSVNSGTSVDTTRTDHSRRSRKRYVDVADEYSGGAWAAAGASHAAMINSILEAKKFQGQEFYLSDAQPFHIDARLRWRRSVTGRVQGPRIVAHENAILNVTAGFQNDKILSVEGYGGSVVALTADAAVGDRKILLASDPGLVLGSWLKLGSNDPYPGQTGASLSCLVGESVVVESKSGTSPCTVWLREPLAGPAPNGYRVSDAASITLINDVQGGGLEVQVGNPFQPNFDALTSASGGMMGVRRQYCRGFKDVVINRNLTSRGYGLLHCIEADAWVEGYDLSDKDGASCFGYVVEVAGVCRDVRFSQIVAERSRHGFTCTKGFEAPRDIHVARILAKEMSSTAVDTHAEGECMHFGIIEIRQTRSIGVQVRASKVTIDSLLIDGIGMTAANAPTSNTNAPGVQLGGIAVWVQGGTQRGASLRLGKAVIRNVLSGVRDPQSAVPTAAVGGHGIRVDGVSGVDVPNLDQADRVQIGTVEVENIDGDGISFGAQLAANGYYPHHVGRYIGNNVGRAKAAGQKYHISQSVSGSSVRPWASQTVIGDMVCEGGDVAVQCTLEGHIRVGGKLESRGVAEAVPSASLRFGQIFKREVGEQSVGQVSTGDRRTADDVFGQFNRNGALLNRNGMLGKVYPKAPGLFSKARMQMAGSKLGTTITAVAASDVLTVSASNALSPGDMIVPDTAGVLTAGTRIREIIDATSVQLTAVAAGNVAGGAATVYQNPNTRILSDAATVNTSDTITVPSTAGLRRGDLVAGSGIPTSTSNPARIEEILSGTQFQITVAATATATVILTVNPGWTSVTDAYIFVYDAVSNALMAYSANLSTSIFDGAYIDDVGLNVTTAGAGAHGIVGLATDPTPGVLWVEQAQPIWIGFGAIATVMGGVRGWSGGGGLYGEDPVDVQGRSLLLTTGNLPPDPLSSLNAGGVLPIIELVR